MMASVPDVQCDENDDFVIDPNPSYEPEPEKPKTDATKQTEGIPDNDVKVYGSSDDDDGDTSFPEPRLGKCQMCEQKDAVYTCPRCEMTTCSLPCSKGHRKNHDCSGVRDRTKFVRVKEFSNLDLLSDYRFLEEAARVAERCHKDKTRMVSRIPGVGYQLPKHLARLKGAARERGIILRYLPQIFSKHKNNSTKYMWKKGVILWKITWNFDEVNATFDSDKVDENKKLAETLAPFLQDSEYKKVLETYQAASFTGVHCLLKAEGRKDAGGKYYELDVSRSIKANLKGKLIVEHPVINVVTSPHLRAYDVIPDDTDEKPAMDWDGPKAEPAQDEEPSPPPPAEEPTASPSNALVDPDAEFERMYSEYYKEYLSQYMRAYDTKEPGQLPTELIDKAHWYESREKLPEVKWRLSGGNGKAANGERKAVDGEEKAKAGGGLVGYGSDKEDSGSPEKKDSDDDSSEPDEGGKGPDSPAQTEK